MIEDDEIGSCEADARDAARYRALADAVGDETVIVIDANDATWHSQKAEGRVIGSLGLEVLAEKLIAEQEQRT